MKLFDDFDNSERVFRPAFFVEQEFDYLNISGKEEFCEIRARIEGWFSHYPSEHAKEFRSRFRSQNDYDHYSAYFELFLHELLRKMGCKIVVHSKANPYSDKKPDFLVKSAKGCEFYLEAVIATAESKEEFGKKVARNKVYDRLNSIKSEDFSIGMELEVYPNSQPPEKKIVRFLEEKLRLIRYETLFTRFKNHGYEAMPRWLCDYDGWRIKFFPIPKEQRGKMGVRPLKIRHEAAVLADDVSPLKKAILKKATRYGSFDLPYIVGVNTLSISTDDIDIQQALFGMEVYDAKWWSEEITSKDLNGVWIHKSGPRNTRVSGVLFTKNMLPTNLSKIDEMFLYHNPWASKKYTCDLTRLRQANLSEAGRMELKIGEKASRILGYQ